MAFHRSRPLGVLDQLCGWYSHIPPFWADSVEDVSTWHSSGPILWMIFLRTTVLVQFRELDGEFLYANYMADIHPCHRPESSSIIYLDILLPYLLLIFFSSSHDDAIHCSSLYDNERRFSLYYNITELWFYFRQPFPDNCCYISTNTRGTVSTMKIACTRSPTLFVSCLCYTLWQTVARSSVDVIFLLVLRAACLRLFTPALAL